jgi:hypothetical protein
LKLLLAAKALDRLSFMRVFVLGTAPPGFTIEPACTLASE